MRLIIVVGAGASYDCVPEPLAPGLRPPLTANLFSRDFDGILNHYPRARAAAAEIRHHLAPGAMGLETYLREELHRSQSPYRRARLREIPLYLQELFFHISEANIEAHPENYSRLVNAALDLESAVFVTLNYDTILDAELFAQWGEPTGHRDYVDPARGSGLIKLHGSVDWAHEIDVDPPEDLRIDPWMAESIFQLGDAIESALSPSIVMPLQEQRDHFGIGGLTHIDQRDDLSRLRGDYADMLYPALSLPLGPEDEFSCPPGYVSFFEDHLKELEALDVLVIGYSGLDKQVLTLLEASGKPLRSLFIVTNKLEDFESTKQNFVEYLGDPVCAGYAPGGFNSWAQSPQLLDYFERVLPAWVASWTPPVG